MLTLIEASASLRVVGVATASGPAVSWRRAIAVCCQGQRSGPRSRLHGANDGTVFVAPQQPRQPAPVQAGQRGARVAAGQRRPEEASEPQSEPRDVITWSELKRAAQQAHAPSSSRGATRGATGSRSRGPWCRTATRRLFPQACVNRGSFPRAFTPHTFRAFTPLSPRSFEHSPHTYM